MSVTGLLLAILPRRIAQTVPVVADEDYASYQLK